MVAYKKYLASAVCIGYMCGTSSMELSLLLDKSGKSKNNATIALVKNSIDTQAHAYRTQTFPQLKFSEINEKFNQLSHDCQRKALEHMSPGLLLIHGVMVILPQELRKRIEFYLCDGHEKVVKKFSETPFDEAFQLYHDIKMRRGSVDTSIAKLYALSHEERELVLSTISPWYYTQPVITLGDKAAIDALSEDARRCLEGKEVQLINYSDYDQLCKEIRVSSCLSCGVPIGFGASILSVSLAVGACTGNLGLMCNSFLGAMCLGSTAFTTAFVLCIKCGSICRKTCSERQTVRL